MPYSRRDVLELSLLAAPMLLAGCARSKPERYNARFQPLGLGDTRDGVLYVPKQNGPAAPVLLYLHGAGGAGDWVMEHLVPHADRTGTIVIAPDSRGRTWGMITGDEDADDEFLGLALREVFDSYAIDKRRIGIAGFSDGASAALSWGLVRGNVFSAIAAFSPGFFTLASEPAGRPRIFVSHGTQDQILPIDSCGREVVRELREGGYAVDYREFDGGHTVPPEIHDAGLASLLSPSPGASRHPLPASGARGYRLPFSPPQRGEGAEGG